jgi:hypothetical protein
MGLVIAGGGIIMDPVALTSAPALPSGPGTAVIGWALFLLRELGLLWILEWRVNSSERLNRLVQAGYWQAWGFSPVWVRM